MLLPQLRWFALNKPQILHLKRNQQGFALVVVLITLLILAGVVASMLRGQTLKLAQTGNYFNLNEQRQASHNAHRACLGIVKGALQSWSVGAFNWAAPIALSAMDLDIKHHEQQYIGRGPTGLGVYNAR